MLLLNGELNSSVVLEMDNCFGGLASPVPAVITMAGTFLWKRFVRFDIILLICHALKVSKYKVSSCLVKRVNFSSD